MGMHSLKTIGLPLDLLSNPNRIQNSPSFPPEHRVELTLVGIIDSRRGKSTKVIPIDDELRVNPAHRARRLWHLKSEWFSAIALSFFPGRVGLGRQSVEEGGRSRRGWREFRSRRFKVEDLVEELTGACFYGAVAVHDKISPFPR
ncbi:hypothetical protein GTA07_05605 [Rhodococcus hoagii]|nr:hypothetical protein [Prescottella equi]